MTTASVTTASVSCIVSWWFKKISHQQGSYVSLLEALQTSHRSPNRIAVWIIGPWLLEKLTARDERKTTWKTWRTGTEFHTRQEGLQLISHVDRTFSRNKRKVVLYLPLNDEKSVSKSNYTVSFWFGQPGNLQTLIGQRYCHWNAVKCRCEMVIVKRYIKQYRSRSYNRVYWVNIATNSNRSLLGQSRLYAKEHEEHGRQEMNSTRAKDPYWFPTSTVHFLKSTIREKQCLRTERRKIRMKKPGWPNQNRIAARSGAKSWSIFQGGSPVLSV